LVSRRLQALQLRAAAQLLQPAVLPAARLRLRAELLAAADARLAPAVRDSAADLRALTGRCHSTDRAPWLRSYQARRSSAPRGNAARARASVASATSSGPGSQASEGVPANAA